MVHIHQLEGGKKRISVGFKSLFVLRSQIGSISDQRPLGKHSLVDDPTSLKPASHKYVAMEPTVVPLRDTCP